MDSHPNPASAVQVSRLCGTGSVTSPRSIHKSTLRVAALVVRKCFMITQIRRPMLLSILLPPLLFATGEVHEFTVRCTDADGDFAEKAMILRILPAPDLSLFSSWVEQIPSPDERGYQHDPDQDGIPNFLEYAFNLSPQVADGQDAQPVVTLTGHTISINFVRDAGKSDLLYLVEAGESLSAWNEIIYDSSSPEAEYSVNNQGPRMVVKDTKELDGIMARRFLRVRVMMVP